MLLPGPGVVEKARAAERLGYRRAWVSDSPACYGDVWMALALVADGTDSIGLGPAVLVPSLRHVVTQASAIATLEGLAPGRAVAAIGTGFTGRMALGQRALPWREVAEYLRALRALLRGEGVQVDGAAVRLVAPPGALPERPVNVPLLVAANGPKGLAVARELGDGVMTIGGGEPDFEWCAALCLGTVLDDGESPDSERARAAAGPAFVALYHGAYEQGAADAFPGGPEWATTIAALPAETRHLALHEGHLIEVAERDAGLVNGEALSLFTWTDTADGIRARVAESEAAGVSELLFTPGGPDPIRELEAFAAAAGTGS